MTFQEIRERFILSGFHSGFTYFANRSRRVRFSHIEVFYRNGLFMFSTGRNATADLNTVIAYVHAEQF